MIKRRTFEVGSARVTVRSSDGWSEIDRTAIMRELYRALGTLSEDGKRYEVGRKLEARIAYFGLITSNTETVEGDLGFVWPGDAASAEELVTAFNALGSLPSGKIEQWTSEIELCDASSGDPDLAPTVDETDPK